MSTDFCTTKTQRGKAATKREKSEKRESGKQKLNNKVTKAERRNKIRGRRLRLKTESRNLIAAKRRKWHKNFLAGEKTKQG
jgi:hypothetical protein